MTHVMLDLSRAVASFLEFAVRFPTVYGVAAATRIPMLFDLPDDATLYAALLARDVRFDGHAFVSVATKGIFCRLTCPASKPHRENCTFQVSVRACLTSGFRPCKRCRPMQA
jgi:hypothetical protein